MTKPKIKRVLLWGAIISLFLLVMYVIFLFPGLLKTPTDAEVIESDTPPGGFSLKAGDLLVRPNWNWLPGTSCVGSGRNFGHLAIVVQGAEGKSVGETMKKAVVIEALLFDQATRKFIFNSREIVRRTAAITSFGERFKGRRYLLRMELTEDQQQRLIRFVSNQLDDDSYTILSFKKKNNFPPGSPEAYRLADHDQWNCATLAWYAFQYAAGRDIDGNGGILIYPNDIIRSTLFDYPGRRIRF
jgi:hypothetical protein